MQERPLSKPPDSVRGGKTIAGKYRLESMLGTGAMGTVWVATHATLGSKVAVKLVSQDFARSDEAKARFLAEAKAAAQLRSRYVVQMFDSGVTDDGAPYIVMEYLRGESLEERITRAGRVPLDQAVRIIGHVAKGLQRAHTSNIVHRDLKPANIFLASTEDGEEVAKILDFGIAKVDHDDRDYKATATGVIMGTPLYMSPEQARGLRSVGRTSDIYSLGMVTYCSLVGDVPYHAESFGDLVYMVCTQDLPATDKVAPWLPATMDAWFRKACHKEQSQRFQSAEEMYAALLVASQLSQPSPDLRSLPDTAQGYVPLGATPAQGLAAVVDTLGINSRPRMHSASEPGSRASAPQGATALGGSAAIGPVATGSGSMASGSAVPGSLANRTLPFSDSARASDSWNTGSAKFPKESAAMQQTLLDASQSGLGPATQRLGDSTRSGVAVSEPRRGQGGRSLWASLAVVGLLGVAGAAWWSFKPSADGSELSGSAQGQPSSAASPERDRTPLGAEPNAGDRAATIQAVATQNAALQNAASVDPVAQNTASSAAPSTPPNPSAEEAATGAVKTPRPVRKSIVRPVTPPAPKKDPQPAAAEPVQGSSKGIDLGF